MTKHYGSMAATRELVELCRIDGDKYVLDVGCGVGATPAYLAQPPSTEMEDIFQRLAFAQALDAAGWLGSRKGRVWWRWLGAPGGWNSPWRAGAGSRD